MIKRIKQIFKKPRAKIELELFKDRVIKKTIYIQSNFTHEDIVEYVWKKYKLPEMNFNYRVIEVEEQII